jgi:hypothetical protein
MDAMPSVPESTKSSVQLRLLRHAKQNWPQLTRVDVGFHGRFAYITGRLADDSSLPLCRLRYGGAANRWGFAIYLASKDGYQDSALPSGFTAGTPEEALDCACGLYLDN